MATKPVVYAFIDSQNLNLGIKSLGWQLDFQRFIVFLKDKYHVSKSFLFIGFIEENKYLYSTLRSYGYVLVFKPTLRGRYKEIKGNVDAELVLHCMIQFNNYHKAVIVSGDGDFRCLIEYLSSKNKLEKILTPTKHYSSLLRDFAKSIVQVELFKKRIKK